MAALAAGVDDAGEQGHHPRADLGAGTQTELAQDHPVPQGAFGGVVGQRQLGMAQDLEDGLPVVEQLHRQGMGFRMRAALALLAGGAQGRQQRRVLGGQIDRGWTFAGGVHRRHQGFQGVQDQAGQTRGPRGRSSGPSPAPCGSGAPSSAAGARSGGRTPSHRSSASR